MEQDKRLKEILLGGSEKASVHFTEAIMKRVHGLSSSSLHFEPLVSRKLQKAFMVVFAVLVASILLLCLFIASPGIPILDGVAIRFVMSYIAEYYYQILAFIVSFWVVFAVNFLIEKRRHLLRRFFS